MIETRSIERSRQETGGEGEEGRQEQRREEDVRKGAKRRDRHDEWESGEDVLSGQRLMEMSECERKGLSAKGRN